MEMQLDLLCCVSGTSACNNTLNGNDVHKMPFNRIFGRRQDKNEHETLLKQMPFNEENIFLMRGIMYFLPSPHYLEFCVYL